MFGVAQGIASMAFIYGRLGVGAGFVVDGQVYRGTLAGAGEIGHTTMIPSGGAPCSCGNTGCLETLVSEQELVRQAQVIAERSPGSLLSAYFSNGDGAPIDRVFAAARAGDRETLQMLTDRARYMGTALANLVNLLNPEMIILGGLFAVGEDLLMPEIAETMRQRSFAGLGRHVTVRVTSFGRKVGVVGAAALALDAFFYQQQSGKGQIALPNQGRISFRRGDSRP
jgi:glucokinase